ncbi:MAG: type II secretion system protein [bacterium]|nr:type II secretion system protein [bacterium]
MQCKDKKGFSLIEVVVAMAVFALALVAISGIFLSIVRAQRKANIAGKVQVEARTMLDTITAAVQNCDIDYSAIINPAETLVLKNKNGETVVFSKAGNRLMMSVGGSANKDLMTDKVKVDKLKFWVNPNTDPFAIGGPNIQPTVTILLTLSQSAASAKPEDKASVQIQTTVTQRVYKR